LNSATTMSGGTAPRRRATRNAAASAGISPILP
jgi:hypothetical protein